MSTIKVFVYAEHSAHAGHLVPARIVDDRGEDSHDFRVYEGTVGELVELVQLELSKPSLTIYQFRCIESLLEALHHRVEYKVRDASGQYIRDWDDDTGEDIRTPVSNEAYAFYNRAHAGKYLIRETDKVVIEALPD